jgi:biopolymer transport protein ExbB/TolQ
MSEKVQPKPIKPSLPLRRIVIYAAVLLVVFLLGLIPMWLKAGERASDLAAAQRELRLLQMQNTLASAVIDARRAEYEQARQAASNFFTSLSSEVDRASESALTQPQREKVTPLFTERDELITLLARSDPASADRLSNLYVSYRKIMNS